MDDFDKSDVIYDSMLKRVFQEYCDLCMSYLPEDKVKVAQELGRTKAHTQKKRAKSTLLKLPKAKRVVFLNGCYDELKVQLLRQLFREIPVVTDYEKAERFLTEIVDIEKKCMNAFVKEINKEEI